MARRYRKWPVLNTWEQPFAVLNDLLTASDDGQVSLLTLLDLSAAFDTTDHDRLFHRLEHVFGIHNSALSFFRSYLTERKQMVSILDTVQILPLSFMAYLRAQFSVPFGFYSTHNHSHRLLIDTQFPHSEFADDSQLYDSVPHEQLDSLLSNMQSCVDDVKLWMTKNKLQLNEGKTETLLIDPQNSPNLPLSITIGQSDICFSRSVRNLAVIFDDKLSMKQQVSKICQSAYLELRRISSIRHVLMVDATKTLVTSLVLSRLDYCCQGFPNS